MLEQADCDVEFSPNAGPLPADQVARLCRSADAVIASSDPYHRAVFDECPRLKIVARCGVGIDSVHLQDATAHGILVTNTPGAMTDAVADYTFALLLGLVRHIPAGYDAMRRGNWTEFPGIELPGKTIGIVGFGLIGQAVARRALGFDMKVLAYDPILVEQGGHRSFDRVMFTSLDELFEQSHIVSLHCPNLPETYRMVDAKRLAKMRSDAYLINTARGSLVDEDALLSALENHQIAGAAIDVYEKEPLPANHRLRSAPRLLLTPHNAFNSREAARRMSDTSAQSIIDWKNGIRPKHLCNPEVCDQTLRSVSNRDANQHS